MAGMVDQRIVAPEPFFDGKAGHSVPTVNGIMNAMPFSVSRPGSRFLLPHKAAAVVVEL